MSSWTLLQIVLDIFLAAGVFLILMRLARAPKDDPRLSRGLQLLQSKISVLEDLSDRTEVQVGQLIAILEQKAREVQAKVQLAEQHVHAIRVAMDRSLDVAKIFQDKIPHQEIIERQNTIKYVQAARLAHQGVNVDEIASRVDLPKGEIEFISKVNRERLMFNEDQLPWWAKNGGQENGQTGKSDSTQMNGAQEQAQAMGVYDGIAQQRGHFIDPTQPVDTRNFAGATAFPQLTAKEMLRENEDQNDEPLLIFPQASNGQRCTSPQTAFAQGMQGANNSEIIDSDCNAAAISNLISDSDAMTPHVSHSAKSSLASSVTELNQNHTTGATATSQAAEGAALAILPMLTTEEENARRLRAEVELAEHQRLVENLSRLQFEMQNLDIQLAKENSNRNLAQAFEPHIPTASSLHRLGEEFKKACNDANPQESKVHTLAPLEQFSSSIPKSLFHQELPEHKVIFDEIDATASSEFNQTSELHGSRALKSGSELNIKQVSDHTANQIFDQSANQSFDQSANQNVNQSANQNVNQSANESFDHGINQSDRQSLAQNSNRNQSSDQNANPFAIQQQAHASGVNLNQPAYQNYKTASSPASENRDPVLARAAAQAKVQAALRLGAKSMAKTQAQLQNSDRVLASETGRDNQVDALAAARDMAKGAAVQAADSIALTPSFYGENVNRVINGRSKDQPAPVIRKIEFPRIN